MKKTKIAFCLRDMRIGGAEACLIRTLDELVKRDDLEIIVVTYVPVCEPVYKQWFAAHENVKTYALYPCRWLGTNLAHFFMWRIVQHGLRDLYRGMCRRLFGLRDFSDVDVWIDYYEFGFAAELKNIQKPKITWWHSSINKFNRGDNIKYIADYDKMITLTDDFTNEFCKLYPDAKNKVTRIYNPVDIAGVREMATRGDTAPVKDYFVTVARLQPDKDVETTLRAFNEFWIKNKRPDIHLVIVGGGSLDSHFRSIAASLPAAKKIIFTGALSNPFGFMAGARANILSSYSEGLPTVLIEGAIVGTLNISSNCKNGPREILLDGAGGILFTPGNVSELASAMTAVYKNEVPIDDMIMASTNALLRFDAKTVVGEIMNVIKNI